MPHNKVPPALGPGGPGEDEGLPLRSVFIFGVSGVCGAGTGVGVAEVLGTFPGVAAGLTAGFGLAAVLHGLLSKKK